MEYATKVQEAASKVCKEPISCPIEARFLFVMPIPTATSKKKRTELIGKPHIKKTGDIDNLIKAVTDPLNGIAYLDDSQIYKIIAEKIYGEEPRTEITLN